MARRDTGLAPGRRIAFRIGINFGEVLVDDDEIYGHGLIIAVRLESVADPDGIFVAQSVYEQVRADPRFRTAYLGEHLIKNLSEPLAVYRILLDAPAGGGAVPGPARRAPVAAPLPIPPCPYRGLFAFREEDAPFFFGRDQAAAELEQAVQSHAAVTLLGAVRQRQILGRVRRPGAAAARRGRLADQRASGRTTIRSRALLRALGATLEQAGGAPPDERGLEALWRASSTAATLAERRRRPAGAGARAAHADHRRPVRADLHALPGRRAARAASSRTCSGSRGAPAPRIVVLLTLRADFLSQALESRAFAEALRGGDVKLGPMSPAELRAAIENPARKLGVRFEMGLVDRILTDVQSQPGGLPLLEFALTELWAQQRNGRLSHLGYQEIGGVAEAIAAYAERIYCALDEADQQLARQVFLRLVRPGHGTEDTRRIASRGEIDDQRWATVIRLADARLLVTQRDEGSGEDVAEVVHEALIREWRRLRQWVDADREFLVWQLRLSEARQEWERYRRADGYLLRATPLAVALDWLDKRGGESLAAEDLRYIEASRVRQQQEAEEAERVAREQEAERHRGELERQRLQAEAARRLARRTRVAAAALMLVALVAAGFGWWGWGRSVEAHRQQALALDHARVATEQREVALAAQSAAEANESKARAAEQDAVAEQQRAEAETRRAQIKESQLLALLSRQQSAQGDAVTGMLLALKGLPQDFAPPDRPIEGEARRALVAAIQGQRERAVLRGHEGEVWSAAFSPDGARIVTAAKDATARVWDVASRAPSSRCCAAMPARSGRRRSAATAVGS